MNTQKKTDSAGTKSARNEIFLYANYIMRNEGMKMEFADFPGAAFDRWKMTLPDEENEPLTTDWRGDYVGKDDPHYTIGSDVVLKDDLECYVISEFAVIIDGELVFNINDTIIDPEHLAEYIESEFGPATEV